MKRCNRNTARRVDAPYPNAYTLRRCNCRLVNDASRASCATSHDRRARLVEIARASQSSRESSRSRVTDSTMRSARSRPEGASSTRARISAAHAGPTRSANSTRRSRNSPILALNRLCATPGRNRTPTARVPSGRRIVHPDVSGPQTRTSPADVHTTSTHPSGVMLCHRCIRAVHAQTTCECRSADTATGVYQSMCVSYGRSGTTGRRRRASHLARAMPVHLDTRLFGRFEEFL